jgi:hypothetical protein
VLAVVQNRYDVFEEDFLDEGEAEEQGRANELLAEWIESPHFSALPEAVKEDAHLAVSAFADYAYSYEGEYIDDWTVETVISICTDAIPRKVSASAEEIGLMADALAAFFDWLYLNKLHSEALKMRNEVRRIKSQMVRIAADPNQWGMAKNLVMGAIESGIDMNDKEAFDNYLDQMQEQSLSRLAAGPSHKPIPTMRENPYKNLSRNELITVRYKDGTEKTGKFKRLEEDLRSGKCSLVQGK